MTDTVQSGSEIEVSFLDLLRIVRRRAWLIVLIPVLFTLSVGLVARRQIRHTAEARVCIQDYPILFGVYAEHHAHLALAKAPEFLDPLHERIQTELTPGTDSASGKGPHAEAELARESGGTAFRITASADSPEKALALLDLWLAVYRDTARPYHAAFVEKQLNADIRQVRRDFIMSGTLLDAVDVHGVETEGAPRSSHLDELRMNVAMQKAQLNLLTEVRGALSASEAQTADLSDKARAYRDVLLTDADDSLILDGARLTGDGAVSVRKLFVYFAVSLFLTGGLILFVESARSGDRQGSEDSP